MASVGFYNVTSVDNCPICFDTMDGPDPVVAHHNMGERHPIHRDCMKEWIEKTATDPACPTCKVPVKVSSLVFSYSWRERVAINCNRIFNRIKIIEGPAILLGTILMITDIFQGKAEFGVLTQGLIGTVFTIEAIKMPSVILILGGTLGTGIATELIAKVVETVKEETNLANIRVSVARMVAASGGEEPKNYVKWLIEEGFADAAAAGLTDRLEDAEAAFYHARVLDYMASAALKAVGSLFIKTVAVSALALSLKKIMTVRRMAVERTSEAVKDAVAGVFCGVMSAASLAVLAGIQGTAIYFGSWG